MSKLVLRHFKSDGLAAIVDLGFIPDLVKVHLSDGTNIDILTWFKRMYDDEAIYATIMTGDSGITTVASTAATGISEYDTVTPKAMLPAPSGEGEQAQTLPLAWTQTRSSGASARSTTALGTLIKPTSGNETGYVYECTTDATGGSTEPTWPTIPGESVTDGTVTWICRELKIKNVGAKGIQIGADVINNDDGNEIYIEAYGADKDPADLDAGDIVAGDLV